MPNLLFKLPAVCGFLERYGLDVICVGTQDSTEFSYANNSFLVIRLAGIHLADKSKFRGSCSIVDAIFSAGK